MDLELTPSQRSLRDEVRRYFASTIVPLLDQLPPGENDTAEAERRQGIRSVIRRLGSDGWLGIGWPVEYGGRGLSAVDQYLFFEEAVRHDVPLPLVTLNTVGPAVMHFGTDEQKRRFLPPILRGELHVAIGYSEPQAGTDLASLATRARRDGDEWVISGQKLWTTGAEDADYVWLAARTAPEAPPHQGISMFLVDTTLAGFSLSPIWTLVGHRTNATFYDSVRVPADTLVGPENGGWRLLTAQLNFERSSIVASAPVERLLDEVAAWARATPGPDGQPVLASPAVQMTLARVRARVEALRLLNLRVASGMTEDPLVGAVEASTVKVFGTELCVEAYRLLGEVVGEPALLTGESAGAVLGGRLQRNARRAVLTTFGGGVNEIQRGIIAMLALGMPRALS